MMENEFHNNNGQIGASCGTGTGSRKASTSSTSDPHHPLGHSHHQPPPGGTTINNILSKPCKKPSLESEDSSYDSDYEVSSVDGLSHYDVSRTVSDTLGQEFDEYITSASPGVVGVGAPGSEGSRLTFLQDHPDLVSLSSPTTKALSNLAIDEPLYQSRLDFARKLGYSEEQVKIALSKLGPSASQNELLAELIQLDCVNSSMTGHGHLGGDEGSLHLGVPGGGNLLASLPPVKPIVLRHIVIDGSNVAMSHGNNSVFSCRGIQIAVDYFRNRGHKEITVFVPSYRKEASKPEDPISEQEILLNLEKEGIVVLTPSRTVSGRRQVCYDDRYILRLAVDTDGIVVSNDNYRDLTTESPEFKKVIEERTLMYSFVNDRFMPPEDPLGRWSTKDHKVRGPTLDQFLAKTPLHSAPPCPYGRKCTYGAKCKYFHPIIKQSVSENLRKQAALKLTQSLPISSNKQTLISRTKSAVPLGVGVSGGGGGGPYGGSHPIFGPLQPPQHPHPSHHHPHLQAQLSSPAIPNPHKKLQRQLSINPVSDPRISHLPLGASSSSSGGHGGYGSRAALLSYRDAFPLPVPAGGGALGGSGAGVRHSLSSLSPGGDGGAATGKGFGSQGSPLGPSPSESMSMTSTSKSSWDPFPTQPGLGEVWSPPSTLTSSSGGGGGGSSLAQGVGMSHQQQSLACPFLDDDRQLIFLQLSAIFPKHQVSHVMQLYPGENDPQVLCRHIIKLFT